MPAENAHHGVEMLGFSLESILAAIVAAFSGLLGLIVRGHREKIKSQDKEIEKLVDKVGLHDTSIGVLVVQHAECERKRIEIWQEIRDLRRETQESFKSLSGDMSDIKSTLGVLHGRFEERS